MVFLLHEDKKENMEIANVQLSEAKREHNKIILKL